MRSIFNSAAVFSACLLVRNVASLAILDRSLENLLDARAASSSQSCSSASKTPASTQYGKELYTCTTSDPSGDTISTNITNTVKTLSAPLSQSDALAAIAALKTSLVGPVLKTDYRKDSTTVSFLVHICDVNADVTTTLETVKSGLDGLTSLLPITWSGKSVGQAVGYFTDSGTGSAGVATYVLGQAGYPVYSGAYTCVAGGVPTTSDD